MISRTYDIIYDLIKSKVPDRVVVNELESNESDEGATGAHWQAH
jgi:hypothetical protein